MDDDREYVEVVQVLAAKQDDGGIETTALPAGWLMLFTDRDIASVLHVCADELRALADAYGRKDQETGGVVLNMVRGGKESDDGE